MGCDHRDEGINDIAKEYIASKGGGSSFYENTALLEIFGGTMRPGGLAITHHAVDLAGFKEGDKILDVGCGYGLTVELLNKEYGLDSAGVDISEILISRGKDRNPQLDLSFGDGEMLDYPSLIFDGIFMECVLSLIDKQEEAIHEAYCLLKKGGKLIISDFYLKDSKSIKDFKKVFSKGQVEGMLSDMGFKILAREDKDRELKEFTASIIMHYGSVENFFQSLGQEGDACPLAGMKDRKSLGYFLMVAEKV